jgi:lysophospholipase
LVLVDLSVRRRSLPPDARWEEYPIDGWPIRTVHWRPTAAKAPGSVMFVGGRADFIEKYSEAFWTWNVDWGLGLAAFDWRGQGLSGRMTADPHKGHVDDFARWIGDLGDLIDWFERMLPAPHFLVAHSMGAHLALCCLARGRSPIARGVLLAPMLGIRTAPLAPQTARRIAEAAVRCGLGERYGLLQSGYGPRQQRPERRALLTGCAERFADEHRWIAERPGLALGGVTWAWLAGAYRSIDALLAPGMLEAIEIPLLVLLGEHEALVDAEAARAAADRLADGQIATIAGGRHELLREVDGTRLEAQANIRRFLLGSA